MGLGDARQRRADAAAAQQQPVWADLYRQTAAEVDPLMRRLAAALKRRVPVAEYRRRFEADRAAQFAKWREHQPKARRSDFVSTHTLDGSVEIWLLNDEPDGVGVTAVGRFDNGQKTSRLRLHTNLGTTDWNVSVERTMYTQVGPDEYYWLGVLSPGQSPSREDVSCFSSYGITERDRRVLVESIEECVVLLIDYYNIPQEEVEV